VAVSTLAGCGGDPAPIPDLAVGVSAKWFAAAGPGQIGFDYYVLVEQRPRADGTCDKLPASLQITALDQPVPVALDSNGCLKSTLIAGPFLQQPPEVVVTIQQDGKMVAQAMTSALTPGARATLVSPADGIVHEGDEVVVAPPPELPSSGVRGGDIFLLDQPPPNVGQYYTGSPTRLADGVHATMPAFTGRAALIFRGSPSYIVNPMLTCDRLAICTSIASNILGPVIVTGEM
jgi:hypothetical protein